jgi:tetratricopeptide (TPR) repeat protein
MTLHLKAILSTISFVAVSISLWVFVFQPSVTDKINSLEAKLDARYNKLFELIQGLRGTQLQKATQTGFERELTEEATEQRKQAEHHFRLGEERFAVHRYQEAGEQYQLSIAFLPTMSAFMNLGLSWYNISNYSHAKAVFLNGLEKAQAKKSPSYESAFVNNIGLVYKEQGQLEAALASHQAALKIFKELDHSLGQARTLGNIGLVYNQQGQFEAALASHQAALKIFKELDHPLGQARMLGHIGLVYEEQGQREAALNSYSQARTISTSRLRDAYRADKSVPTGDSKIAYYSGDLDKLMVIHTDGTPADHPYPLPEGHLYACSADGRKIAFWTEIEGREGLYVSAIDGIDPVYLPYMPHTNDLSISYDGTRLAFVRMDDIYVASIFRGWHG